MSRVARGELSDEAGGGRSLRVVRLYHSAVVDEYRNRERLLRNRHGHDVHVICPPAWTEGGVLVRAISGSDVPLHVVEIHGSERPNLFRYDLAAVRRILRAVQPDIVDLHEEPFSLAAGGVLRAVRRVSPRAKLCVYGAQNLNRRYPPPFSVIERQILRTAGAAYPCSEDAGERLKARGFRGSIHVLPLGVTIPERVEDRSGTPTVGFVGRLEPYKGGLLAVRAFAVVAAQTNATMEVIGAGPQLGEMQQEAARSGLASRIRFTGALSQAETLFRIGQMDVVLVPSITTRTWKEQFGRVPVQAMAHGAVVIASDSGSLREVVGDSGILAREGDEAAFSHALQSLLDNPSRWRELRDRGRARAANRYSWEAVSDGVDQMYRQLMSGM